MSCFEDDFYEYERCGDAHEDWNLEVVEGVLNGEYSPRCLTPQQWGILGRDIDGALAGSERILARFAEYPPPPDVRDEFTAGSIVPCLEFAEYVTVSVYSRHGKRAKRIDERAAAIRSAALEMGCDLDA